MSFVTGLPPASSATAALTAAFASSSRSAALTSRSRMGMTSGAAGRLTRLPSVKLGRVHVASGSEYQKARDQIRGHDATHPDIVGPRHRLRDLDRRIEDQRIRVVTAEIGAVRCANHQCRVAIAVEERPQEVGLTLEVNRRRRVCRDIAGAVLREVLASTGPPPCTLTRNGSSGKPAVGLMVRKAPSDPSAGSDGAACVAAGVA